MKRMVLLVFGFILLSNISWSQDVNKNLEKLRTQYIKALKNSDTEAILKIYADDASIHHVDGTLLNGSNEIRDFYDRFFENSKATIEFKNVSEEELAKNIFFYHDKVFLKIKGEDVVRNIEVVNIAEKIDGKWRVIKSYRWPVSK